ncbi:MAG TPA: YjbE family putative metal transport protein [Acetobacteraceae bacterium]|nr:YjbE family putative metal transport protein [Acetobacteraceae bacterium]
MPHWLIHDFGPLIQVVLIDIALAGDNAIVVGLAVAGLPSEQRRLAIVLGIAGATAIRIGFGLVAISLLKVLGLTLAGGLLLLWVAWKMYRELRRQPHPAQGEPARRKSMTQAMLQIILADVSMSLDNVLAVAGAAADTPWVLVAGLLLSVALMGAAAEVLARLVERQRWIAWVGLLIVLSVAVRMIWEGSHRVAAVLS